MQEILSGGHGCSDLGHSDCSMVNQGPLFHHSLEMYSTQEPHPLPLFYTHRTASQVVHSWEGHDVYGVGKLSPVGNKLFGFLASCEFGWWETVSSELDHPIVRLNFWIYKAKGTGFWLGGGNSSNYVIAANLYWVLSNFQHSPSPASFNLCSRPTR